MMKSSVTKMVVPLLLLLFLSTGVAYADGVGFRLTLRDPGQGVSVVIFDDIGLDTSAATENLIGFSTGVGTKGFATGKAVVTKVGNNVIMTLSASATYAGPGTMELILEESFSADTQNAALTGSLGGLLAADLTTMGANTRVRNANATFNTYVDRNSDADIDATDVAAFGAGRVLSSPTTLTNFPTYSNGPVNLGFATNPYSLVSVATINFTGGSTGLSTGFVDFALRGELSGDWSSAAVPEPATLLLLGSGLLGLGLLRRRK